MIETHPNYYRVVGESLSGKRPVDEQTLTALTVLDERLERLKELDSVFQSVGFSTDIEKLRRHKNAVTVG
ncbi:MAG: hypothetical protein P8Z79_19680 [Sedimentisphaerales bacterium]